MRTRLKDINMDDSKLDTLDINKNFTFKKTYDNIYYILRYDKTIKNNYLPMLMKGKIDKAEFKELVIMYVKYFYDIDIRRNYGRYYGYLKKRNSKFTKGKGEKK